MKKLLLNLCVLMLSTSAVYSQIESERKIGIKEIDLTKISFEKGKVDCRCNKNILQDGGFENLTSSGSDIASTSTPWKKGYKTPQWTSSIQTVCDKGVVSMWGNQVVGESIYQNGISLTAGSYKVKFTARFVNPTTLSTFVRLKLFLYSGTGISGAYDAPGVISTNINSNAWATYTTTTNLTVSTGGTYSIALHPENDYTQDDGSYVSWIQLDNICIEKACEIPDVKCSPSFSAAPFTVNSQGNVIINVNPVITSGAQHYWGLLGASGLGDLTPIPFSTIISGGSFGLAINSTGSTATIGMGTGINASTSGYGYSYQGVDVGKCFKITHYIKCCDKWYSQTKTYCTQLCSEVKESAITEVPAKDVPNLDARPGDGRG